ncbi:hypothetical protein AB1N83_009762 [Pleurotus pulmonarius]
MSTCGTVEHHHQERRSRNNQCSPGLDPPVAATSAGHCARADPVGSTNVTRKGESFKLRLLNPTPTPIIAHPRAVEDCIYLLEARRPLNVEPLSNLGFDQGSFVHSFIHSTELSVE